ALPAPHSFPTRRSADLTTASVTPARTHSSTSVAAKVAWTSAGAGSVGGVGMQRQESPAVRLHGERAGSGPRLVLLHGFGQTANCWGPLAADLAADHEVVRLDAPGHGGSAEVAADLPTTGRLVAEAGGPAVQVGYSLGARMALHVATEAPEVVRGLVLHGG